LNYAKFTGSSLRYPAWPHLNGGEVSKLQEKKERVICEVKELLRRNPIY
jgi:hypothetical protein